MSKKKLIETISDTANLSKKEAEAALKAVMESITKLLAQGDSIVLPGFASFSVKMRAARTGRNPSTGQTIEIPASKAVSFKMRTALKEIINKPE
jgi:DNA-binding protein HU-beta